MNYRVKLHPKVAKFLDKCEKTLSLRITEKLRLMKEDPFRFIERLAGQDFYKLRIGDYRAIIDVDAERKIVFVRIVDHRSRIYKRL